PLFVHGVAGAPTLASASNFAVKGGVVKLDTVKPSEDGQGAIIRLYETRGTNHDVVFCSRRKLKKMQEVTLLEEPAGVEVEVSAPSDEAFGSEARLEFKPFQIRSFRIVW
ncbi:MAG: glycosyl hydrolase-related protein, partial [Spirochaetales bacterium]